MNDSLLLHIVQKLEGFAGKLPGTLQAPILRELTPLKELFLQQHAPRLVLTGASKFPLAEVVAAAFHAPEAAANSAGILTGMFRWQAFTVGAFGTLDLLDARGADETALAHIEEELARQPADAFLFLFDATDPQSPRDRDLDLLISLVNRSDAPLPAMSAGAKIAALAFHRPARDSGDESNVNTELGAARARFQAALSARAIVRDRLIGLFDVPIDSATDSEAAPPAGVYAFLAALAQALPNQARVEMIRLSRNREAQAHIADALIKSTTAICAAIGAQPIPLADLPILTTLQLVMVSGIMYISGRERSLRAATEFSAAMGANIGAGMMLREGTRAVLKFFPGWGNVVSGMVAGAGTYAIGRAATGYFIEGVSLKAARRLFVQSRRNRAAIPVPQRGRSAGEPELPAEPAEPRQGL